MKKVIIESPFDGHTDKNHTYAKACMLDCFARNEAPLAAHVLYREILDESNPEERRLGIYTGLIWAESAEATVVYTDLGVSHRMKVGIEDAQSKGRAIEYRSIAHFKHLNS